MVVVAGGLTAGLDGEKIAGQTGSLENPELQKEFVAISAGYDL